MENLRSSRLESPLGQMLAVASESGLCGLYLDGDPTGRRLDQWRRRFAPSSELTELDAPDGFLGTLRDQLDRYFAGDLRRFDLELDARGTPFQREVWAELQRIPFGRTASYGELGRRLGRPRASRAVGAANGANPLPIVVPCHRVVAASGIGGFSGGLERKLALLRLEGVLLPTASSDRGLFD